MASAYASSSFLDYLREAALSGRLHPATARSRRKAAQALFEYLGAQEHADLRTLDVAALAARVHDARDGILRSEVVELYASRLEDALSDFFAEPSVAAQAAIDASASRLPEAAADSDDGAPVPSSRAPSALPGGDTERALERIRLSFDRHRADVIPIPLERGRVVYVHGMPADLSPAEARKIARVVEALAGADDEA